MIRLDAARAADGTDSLSLQAEMQALYGMAPVGFCCVDTDLRLVRINEKLLRMSGAPMPGLTGRHLDDALPGIGNRLELLFRQVLTSGAPIEEVELSGQLPGPAAKSFHWLCSFLPLKGPQGRPLGANALVRDITRRKLAEQTAREREARLNLAIEGAGMGSWDIDLKTGKGHWSKTFYAMLGYDPSQTPASTEAWRRRVHPDDADRAVAAIAQARDGRSIFNPTYRVIRASGETVWLQEVGRFLYDDDGTPTHFIGVSFDITQRVRAEQALRESEELARARLAEIEAVYRTAPVAMCVLDHELRFIRINNRMAEINGVSAAAHLGRTVQEILPGTQEQVIGYLHRILETGEPLLDFELVGQTPAQPGVERIWNENWFPLRNAAGQIVGINVVAEEITERKRAETALRESEERFRQFAENSNDALWIVDARRGQLDYLSPAYEKIWGISRSGVLTDLSRWSDTIHPDDLPRAKSALPDTLAGRSVMVDYRILRPDGAVRWIRDTGFPIRNDRGDIYRVGGISRDITERKQAEDELRAALARANLLLGEVHHRVKNSVQAVTAVLRMEKRATASTEMQKRFDAVIRRVMAIGRVHDRLYRTEQFDEVEFGGYLKALCDEIARSILPADRALRVEAEEAKLSIRVATSLGLVATELVVNAMKHGRGVVHVRFSRIDGKVLLAVSDEGSGPPAEFTPESSTGLGAKLADNLTRLLGGECTWQGATCTIAVPYARSQRAR